ncbi:hypothetical protein SAMN04488023_14020 [Pedobacter rhizosphaerae]|uniref:Uncharacterized protein n=1 Tax=Pedobacter rhizosphaerae TaxID=390241 RepID=A0A1H9VAT9_9SPHI|nr:hypothetical protein SAMN04488023_14020 [Pedobacter rhizosphaerae]
MCLYGLYGENFLPIRLFKLKGNHFTSTILTAKIAKLIAKLAKSTSVVALRFPHARERRPLLQDDKL